MSDESSPYNVVGILGSVRPNNYTARAMALVADEFGVNGIDFELIDPAKLDLPLPGTESDSSDAATMREQVQQATGVILATPEYHGSYSSVIKLVIDNLGFPSVLSGKPIGLVGVAAGAIGAIKALEHLRSVCAHVGGIVLPAFVSIPGVNRVFDDEGNCTDEKVEKRIRGAATNLHHYVQQNICPRITLEAMVREQA
ncbi:MAG: NAD(P)H-dependent oxidoreductase [Verrucomicrobia bacterium]|nr:NAD(P)H-dependent oxidoreductase [Verrucomicrobiota bacterium]